MLFSDVIIRKHSFCAKQKILNWKKTHKSVLRGLSCLTTHPLKVKMKFATCHEHTKAKQMVSPLSGHFYACLNSSLWMRYNICPLAHSYHSFISLPSSSFSPSQVWLRMSQCQIISPPQGRPRRPREKCLFLNFLRARYAYFSGTPWKRLESWATFTLKTDSSKA